MSGLIPRYGGRSGEWDFCYGPCTHGQLPVDVDPDDDTLPPVDHSDIGYDECGIKMSLRSETTSKDY